MKRTISKSERPYRLLLCVMISLLVIMLAGCSTSSDSDTNTRGFTDFATIEEEYLTTIESLNWPEGFTPPDALEGEDTGASFQIGYGDTRASNLWEYSWMQEWLDTYNTNSERAALPTAQTLYLCRYKLQAKTKILQIVFSYGVFSAYMCSPPNTKTPMCHF